MHRTSTVVVQAEGGLAALAVDRIVGTAHITLRAPPELMPVHPLLAGVCVDLEGRPQLVLDPDGLCAFARASLPKLKASEAPLLPVLVIDDSLTTRMLEQSILESAGYNRPCGGLGRRGHGARAAASRTRCSWSTSRCRAMDGFTFVERTRADPVLRQVAGDPDHVAEHGRGQEARRRCRRQRLHRQGRVSPRPSFFNRYGVWCNRWR